jgi:hypothetical protein
MACRGAAEAAGKVEGRMPYRERPPPMLGTASLAGILAYGDERTPRAVALAHPEALTWVTALITGKSCIQVFNLEWPAMLIKKVEQVHDRAETAVHEREHDDREVVKGKTGKIGSDAGRAVQSAIESAKPCDSVSYGRMHNR